MLDRPEKKYELHTLSDAVILIFTAQISSDYLTIIKRDIMPQLGDFEDIGLRELRALMVIDYYDTPVSSASIAEVLRYDPGTVSRAVKTLEECGYLFRDENKDDARSFVFFVTDRGKELANRYRELFSAHFREMDQRLGMDMTEEERKTVIKLLMKLRHRSHMMLNPPRFRF